MNAMLLGVALAVGAPAAKDDPTKNPPSLVGEWVAEKGVRGGDDRAVPAESVRFEFAADGKVRITEGSKSPEGTEYTADPKKVPAEVSILLPPGKKEPPILGIYKVEGDTLTICLRNGGDRPTTFESPKGSDVMLLTLKRVKRKE
jgi:uncharacterized protein (TIGR03067 family)